MLDIEQSVMSNINYVSEIVISVSLYYSARSTVYKQESEGCNAGVYMIAYGGFIYIS